MLATANMGKWQQDILATCTNDHMGNGGQGILRKIPISHNTNHPKYPLPSSNFAIFGPLHIMVIAWNVLHPSPHITHTVRSPSFTLSISHITHQQSPPLPSAHAQSSTPPPHTHTLSIISDAHHPECPPPLLSYSLS